MFLEPFQAPIYKTLNPRFILRPYLCDDACPDERKERSYVGTPASERTFTRIQDGWLTSGFFKTMEKE
jgi:hypothetical protein